jgi:Cu+-exporting ATPase
MSNSCDLCGFPLRYGTFNSVSCGKTFRFCCMGCKQVFTMLLEASAGADPTSFRETELFKKCKEMGIIPSSEAELQQRAQSKKHTTYERPVDTYPASGSEGEPPREGKLSLSLKVNHMWCPACAWLIEECLKKSHGVLDAACNFSTDRARCDYDPVLTSPSQIIRTIDGLGYKASMPGKEVESKERKKEFIRFAISAFLTMNVMMLSFALYSGFFTELSQDTIQKLSFPIFVMASIVLFYGGRKIYQRAWAGITSAAFSMETLITAGAFSAYIYSTVNLFSGSIHLY